MKKKLWKDEEKRDSVYRDLAPINSIKPEEESIRALRWAIKNPNVHNIALSGPYGSGKSSVIQSSMVQRVIHIFFVHMISEQWQE